MELRSSPQGVQSGKLVENLVPKGTLALDHASRILTSLALKRGTPIIVAQAHFSPKEWQLLLVLLEAFPTYASYDQLLARVMALTDEESQHCLEQARIQDTLRVTLTPIREAIKTLRPKLASFSLVLIAAPGYGYRLAHISGEKNPSG